MNAQEFLMLLLPSTGHIVTATPLPSKGWAHTIHKSIQSAVAHTNKLTFEGKQSYFALATYENEKVWDASWKNAKGETVGKNRLRTQANAQFLKSFFLDLDVDPSDEKKFASKADAIRDLKAFVLRLALPAPMLVDSGGGIHAYWPLATEVPGLAWLGAAEKFKAIILHEKFNADKVVIADRARVLRVLGGYNFRRDAPVKLLMQHRGPYAFDQLEACFDGYISNNAISAVNSRSGVPRAGVPDTALDDNLGATNDPHNFDRISFACAQIGAQVAVRGAAVGEKLWRAGLGIVKFCEPQALAYRAISDGHAEYDEAATLAKIANWRTGPSACSHFHTENPAPCEACPSWSKITSPAQLGREVLAGPPTIVTIITETGEVIEIETPPPPFPYKRSKDRGVFVEGEDPDGTATAVQVSPYDLYPVKILRQNGEDLQVDERSVWRTSMPKIGVFDMDINQSMIADKQRLYAHMISKGIYLTPKNADLTQQYMSAYLQILAANAEREKLYEHLGWNDEHTSFVLGDKVLFRDGTERPHIPSRSIRGVTKEGIVTAGTLDGWKDAMKFFNRPGYEGHRFFLYASLGAPLFHMNDTGNKGVLMTASGDSGRGKTTCLKACASMWGKPEAIITNGNRDGATINMLYDKVGVMHSLPFFWDDITEQEPDMLRRFLLNISQGQGKERMKGSEHSGKMRTWETIVLASANTDDVTRIISSGKDVDPHLMRLVGVEFKAIDTSASAKIAADHFLRQINANYGHVGSIFMRFVTANYDKVVRGYTKNVEMVDNLLNSSNASAERFWSATVAAAFTGAQIASALGLVDYPIQADLEWMVAHLGSQRAAINEGSSSAVDILSEFLEENVGSTLVVSAKQSSNIDNIMHRPSYSLLVRHEIDDNVIYVSRSAMVEYCKVHRASFHKIETALEASGVVVARNVQKILGADTKYAKGQTRCWKIDNAKLGGAAKAVLNVVPITGVKTA